MQVDVKRIIRDPSSGAISATLSASITEEDIAIVFPCDGERDNALHFDLTGPCENEHSDAKKLEVWMKFAQLLAAAYQAKKLNVTPSDDPEAK